MSGNQKPIDAIRREMNNRGYDVDINTNQREISNILGLNKYSSLKDICLHLGVEFNSNIHNPGFFPSKECFLINIFKPSDCVKFSSKFLLLKSILFGTRANMKIFNDLITNQYVGNYNKKYYVVSDTQLIENISPNFDSPYMLATIRQVMKSFGYDVTYKTNKKEICAMLGLPSTSTKKEICEKLNIPYVNTQVGGGKPWQKIQLTNIYDPSHTVEFRSMRAAEQKLNIRHEQFYTYINEPSLTVPYEGYTFTVSFVEE